MSQQNIDVVRAIHDAWLAGEPGDPWMSEDVEYVNPDYAVEPGTARGPDAFQRVFDVWDEFRFEPERFLAAGPEDVVVVGTAHTGASSTIAVQRRIGYVWTIREGRAVRFRWFVSVDEALSAAGLAGETA
jgi:ketosteroid isomerase-like protein